MDKHEWNRIKHFGPNENWGDWRKMDYGLIKTLDRLRSFVGRPISIHCGYEARATGGFHPLGKAVDIHIEGLHVIDQFLAASMFDYFNGIGVYPWWNNPGIHLDSRAHGSKLLRDARWGCSGPGRYVPLNRDFIGGVI